jgi:putative hydrolase of the HAD superfamily
MIDWSAIDTVLLDMDGTLLDLHFDNFFWVTYLPRRYAEQHGLCPEESTRHLHRRMGELRGTLDWYCLDFWSRELSVDIRALKREVEHLIAERPHAIHFLRKLGEAGKPRVLITNAHPGALDLKLSLTGIGDHLDTIISSHQFNAPKESPAFWRQLHERTGFDPHRTLFIDDSEAILAAAESFGIRYLFCIRQPDSKQPPRPTSHYPAIHHFDEIFPGDTPGPGSGGEVTNDG